MSWSVVRGGSYPSQRHLDAVLAQVLRGAGPDGPSTERDVTLPQILYHCLHEHPHNVFMINGSTGVRVTNSEMLDKAVTLARALRAQCASGTVVMLCMRNHEHAVAVFLAALFAGMLPFMMNPITTVFELCHFVSLVSPRLVFCDAALLGDVTAALTRTHHTHTRTYVADSPQLNELMDQYRGDVEQFDIPCVDPHSAAILIPTSGSTGLPKAAIMTQRGMVIQLPIPWAHYERMPAPTSRAMLLTTLQWMTFSMHLTSCLVYRVTLLLSPEDATVTHVTHMLRTFKPSWTFFGPAFAKSLLSTVTREDLSSLDTLILLGAPSTPELLEQLKAMLPPAAFLVDGYGTTETQGFIALRDRGAPPCSCGPVVNILHYKLMDDEGNDVGLEAAGELYVKGDCLLKGYYNNPDAFSECMVDGWYRTGDKFYIDSDKRLRYVERIKFNFKFRGSQVSPEEVEGVILSVEGVLECCVCGTERGPAAAVLRAPTATTTRDSIHHAVNEALSDHKRLHGGIAFVESLPHTHTGKIQRQLTRDMIITMQQNGECY